MVSMAVPAPKGPERDHKGRFLEQSLTVDGANLMEICAKLYGLGLKRPQVARHIAPYFQQGYRGARRKLRKWEEQQAFRDLMWKHAVHKLDLDTPQILEGVSKAAKRGRVDAAKLALAITERHTDKSDMPAVVELRLQQVERPDRAAIRPGPEREIGPASTTDVVRPQDS